MSSSEQNKKEEAPNTPKVKSRLLDDTGKRLLREIRPLWAWILLSAVICLLLIGCAVAG